MVCAPEMLGNCYRSTNALMPLAADAARLLTARFLACIAGKGRGSIFCGSAITGASMRGVPHCVFLTGGYMGVFFTFLLVRWCPFLRAQIVRTCLL